jgi:SAM-dependent methyltransferase
MGPGERLHGPTVRRVPLPLRYPRPSLEAIDEAAQTGLHETERGDYNAVSFGGFNARKVPLFKDRLRALYPEGELKQRPVRWLDVGCGFGELVAAVEAVAAPGSEIRGIDPCLPKVRVARERGLNVTADTLDRVGGGYDVISLINVFSHLPDPTAFLEQLRGLLNSDGELVLVTGNAADLEATDYPDPLLLPDHLVFAGERHLIDITRRLGFEPVAVQRYQYFYRDPLWLYGLKTIVKRALGRTVVAWRNDGSFRSIFLRARLRS